MKKKKEQNILTLIIVLAIIALAIIIGSIIYEEQIEENKEAVESIAIPAIEEKQETIEPVESENIIQEEETEEYVGEEEQETQKEETTPQNKDEKAIDLVKKEWGEDDTVTFNIEEKNGSKYYVAVKKDATVISWYEVDTENWEINEY